MVGRSVHKARLSQDLQVTRGAAWDSEGPGDAGAEDQILGQAGGHRWAGTGTWARGRDSSGSERPRASGRPCPEDGWPVWTVV